MSILSHPTKTIEQKVKLIRNKFEGLFKPTIKLELKSINTIFAFLDGTEDSKQLIKLLIMFIKELCANCLPRVVLISSSPTYRENQALRELITNKSEKILDEAYEELLYAIPGLEEGLIEKKFSRTSLEDLLALKDEFNPDIAFMSSPYIDTFEILEAVSRHAYIKWIENINVATLIVPNQEDDVISRMFESITLLLNDWRLVNEKINHSLFFLARPKSKMKVLSVIDRKVISELQDLTGLQIQQSLVEQQKHKLEIFIPQLRQIISEDENLKKVEVKYSVKEEDSLDAVRNEIKLSNSGLIIIGQHTKFSYTGKLAAYILQSVKAVPILLIKSKF